MQGFWDASAAPGVHVTNVLLNTNFGPDTVLTAENTAMKNGQKSLASWVSFYGDSCQEKHTRSNGDSGIE